MNLDIKLKTHKVLELVNYLEGKIDSFEELNMILFEDDNFKYNVIISVEMFDKPNVIFEINAKNKITKSIESKSFYITKEKDMFSVFKVNLLGKCIFFKLDLIDRDRNYSYSLYNIYKELTKNDFNAFYDLFKYNQFNEDIYIAEIFALLLSNMYLYRKEATKEQKDFIKGKLSYFGLDFETISDLEFKSYKTKLDELTYNTLFEIFIGSKYSQKELTWESDDLYKDFLTEHYVSSIKIGT